MSGLPSLEIRIQQQPGLGKPGTPPWETGGSFCGSPTPSVSGTRQKAASVLSVYVELESRLKRNAEH